MVAESKQPRRRRSTKLKEQLFPNSKFGRCIVVLADGIKPAQWLAERVKRQGGKCTERHANLLITGKRKPNARAIHVVTGEMLE